VLICKNPIPNVFQTKETDLLLKKLPPLSQPHIRALNKLLDKIVEMVGLTREATEHRQMLVKKLEKLVQMKLPEVKLELYGSSVNGFGLKSSDVNIDIVIPESTSASNTLMGIYKLLRENGESVFLASFLHLLMYNTLFS
jgi:DNA polymerase sigma